MNGFKSYSGYKVGASHVAKNMVCEDYARTYDDENVSIAVISDGHGDRKCFRSSQGAHIACDVAIECVKKICSSANYLDVIKKSPDRIITELERAIIREWNKSVEKDLSSNSISENELNGLTEDTIEAIKSGRSLNKIYGCTLIMCVVFDGFWFGIQIGDGKCVVAMNNGIYKQPIPWDDEGCVGNRSTSICNSNSFAGFRYVYGTDIPTGLFVASDGVDESFDENGLNRCYYTLGYWVQTLQKVDLNSKMEETLSQITNNGSGDDVSIACILNEKNDIKKPYASSEQVAEKLKELIDSIKEKEIQFESLSDSKNEVLNNIDVLKSEIVDLKRKIASCEEEINSKILELTQTDNSLVQVVTQLQKSVNQLPKAKETKERIDQYWKSNGVEINEDPGLDYVPKYSEEYLGTIVKELEEINKEGQVETDKTELKDEVNELVKDESDSTGDEKASIENAKNIAETEEPNTITGEGHNEDLKDFAKQLVVKKGQDNEEIDSKSKNPKNSFFGNLFNRKK